MESEPGNCGNGNGPNIPGTSVPLYSSDHDPAYAYQSNTTCSANDVPMTSSTFNPASLPSFSYIVPNSATRCTPCPVAARPARLITAPTPGAT
jgi:hypothetical protein